MPTQMSQLQSAGASGFPAGLPTAASNCATTSAGR